MDKGFDILKQGLRLWGFELDERQSLQFEKYLSTLLEWNSKMNITRISSMDEIMVFHFLDSISVLLSDKIKANAKVVDIGSGGGFPGLPIKILRPDIRLTLVDSSLKRVSFLKFLVDEIGCNDVKVLHSRAEDLGKDSVYRETFDIALSRAVAELRVLSELCLPLVKPKGFFIAHKGPGANEEVLNAANAFKVLGANTPSLMNIDVCNSNKTHKIIIIEKKQNTPSKYPRSAAFYKKSPL